VCRRLKPTQDLYVGGYPAFRFAPRWAKTNLALTTRRAQNQRTA